MIFKHFTLMLTCCFLLLPSMRMMNKHDYRCGRHIFLLAFPTVLYCKKLWLILTTNLTQDVLVHGLTVKDLADVQYYAKILNYPSFLYILLLRRLILFYFLIASNHSLKFFFGHLLIPSPVLVPNNPKSNFLSLFFHSTFQHKKHTTQWMW